MRKLKSQRRAPTPEEERFARRISRRANRELPFVVGCFGLLVLYFLAAPVLAGLVFLFGLFFDPQSVLTFFGIPVALALLLLLGFVVYATASGVSPSAARVYEVRARSFVSFEQVEDEGAYYAFELEDGRIVFVAGEEFDRAENFPCLDFALVNLLDERKILGSLVECRSPKAEPVRTIPAQITKTLAMPVNLEIRSGKLDNIEHDLRRPAGEIVEAYTYRQGQGMLRKADPEEWKRRLLRKKVDGRAAFLWSKLAKPNVRLLPQPAVEEDTTPPLTSKLGGLPDLPKGMVWPTYQFVQWQPQLRAPGFWEKLFFGRQPEEQPEPPRPEARPLPFLAQINLADIAKLGCDLPLPESGLLLFFYEPHECGFAASETTGARVLFVPEGTETERPSGAPVDSAPARSLECQPGETLPELEYMEEHVPAYSEADFSEVYEVLDEDVESFIYGGSAFAGWPHSVQYPMELECELYANGIVANADGYKEAEARGLKKKAREWRLLLQLDSGDTPELDWGDSGKVYIFCRKQDIAERRFERCCFVRQMH